MALVELIYIGQDTKTIKREKITTTADSSYVFDDISNHVNKDGELSAIPKGTKNIIVKIPCDF